MNPKRFFQRYMPAREALHTNRVLRVVGRRLHDPGLWGLNRRSAALASAVGIYIAFFPLPGHTPLVAVAAVLLRVNLPIMMLTSWIMNPVTLVPLSVLGYQIGAWLLGAPPLSDTTAADVDWMLGVIADGYGSFALGCTVLGISGAVLGYGLVDGLWRIYLIKRWRRRMAQRHPLVAAHQDGSKRP
ncbi:MAG: DUF2062 domain-containing protein [Gammaproteobacteria bacterium]